MDNFLLRDEIVKILLNFHYLPDTLNNSDLQGLAMIEAKKIIQKIREVNE